MSAVAWPFGDLPRAAFRTIVIDPPWRFSGGTKGRPQHYARMTDAEIAALPVRALAHPDGANVFLWIPSPKLFHIPPIAKAWRLRYSGRAFVWLKTHRAQANGGKLLFFHRNCLHTGTGFTTRKNAEDVLLLKCGTPKRLCKNVHEIIISPLREHSRKPDEFFDLVERYSEGPYIELFSRQSRRGWTSWGAEAGKFDAPSLTQPLPAACEIAA